MRRTALVTIPALVVLASLSAAFLQSAPTAAAGSHRRTHPSPVKFPTHDQVSKLARGRAIRAVQGSGDLQWYGGPVQHDPTTFVVFWGSSWKNSSGGLNSVGAVVDTYFRNVGSTSFENILTQYDDGSGYVNNSHSYGGYWIDISAPSYDYSCGGKTIQDTSIQSEVNRAISARGWPRSGDAVYYVYTPNGYYVNDGTNTCSEQYFCAYHNFSSNGLAYGAMAYPFVSGCRVSSSPNGNTTGDSEANLTSHEQFESITDPQAGNGWIDAVGYEIGDKCAWDFSAGYTYLHGDAFELQTEYSNASHSCVNSY